MQDAYKLKCPRCGTILERGMSYDGADWHSTEGDGSGFEWRLDLHCPKMGCGYIYGLGRLRDYHDICEEIEAYRPYNAPGTYLQHTPGKE